MSGAEELLARACEAAANAYAPYSDFAVGAALLFEDGEIVTAANVENASYGLSLCAEAIAVAKAMNAGGRAGLLAIAIVGPPGVAITPCGRCRQLLSELAGLGKTDPLVWCATGDGHAEWRLSQLLPEAFGP